VSPAIPTEKTVSYRVTLQQIDQPDQFYTLTDLQKQAITWTYGIGKWLGYPEGDQTPLPVNFLSSFVPAYIRPWYQVLFDAATLVIADDPDMSFLHHRFVISVPMKRSDNMDVLVRQFSRPCDYDLTGKAATFIHDYVIFGAYSGQPLRLELFRAEEELARLFLTRVQKLILTCVKLRREHNLTPMHWEVLKKIRQLKKDGLEITNKTIARGLKGERKAELKPHSINKNLLKMKDRLLGLMGEPANGPVGEEKPPESFFLLDKDALSVIDYMEQSGVIPLLEIYK
jgi:hypothetical protein